MWVAALAALAGVAYWLPVRLPSPEGTLVVSRLESPDDPKRKWGLWLEDDDGGQLLMSAFTGKLKAVQAALEY